MSRARNEIHAIDEAAGARIDACFLPL